MEICMEIIVCKNYQEMSDRAAELVAKQIAKKPNSVLGLATGSTPEGMYAKLVDMYEAGKLSFSKITSVNLDEYYPLEPTNDQSYRYFMDHKLFDHVDIDKKKTFVPNGLAADPDAEGKAYDEMIKELGGVDLQVLGIGRNGHIGFNEPDEYLIPGTHVTDLTASTIEANARFFDSPDSVPKKALTMGIGTILAAKKIILMVSGADKKAAVAKLLEDKITTQCPATMLKLHTDVTLIVTEDAIN